MSNDFKLGFKITDQIGPSDTYCPYMPLQIPIKEHDYDEANYLLSGMGIVLGESPLPKRSAIRLLSLISILVSNQNVQNSSYRLVFPENIHPLNFEYKYNHRGHVLKYSGEYIIRKMDNFFNEKKQKNHYQYVNRKTEKDYVAEMHDFILKDILQKLKLKNGLHIDFTESVKRI